MNPETTLDTCDSSAPSRISLVSNYSSKFLSDDSMRNTFTIDPTSNPAFVFQLYSSLLTSLSRIYSTSFKLIQLHSRKQGFLTKAEKTKPQARGLYHQKLILGKVVKRMVFTGQLKLIQRPFWLWKFLLPEKRMKKLESMAGNKKIVLRVLGNRLRRLREKKKNLVFNCIKLFALDWRGGNKLNKVACMRALENIAKRSLEIYFRAVACDKWKKVKSQILNLNAFFLKILVNAFKEWQNYYPEICQDNGYEPLNQVKVQLKHHYVIKKPCVPYYFYDIHTYDPAFQATFHNLNHFLKRKLRRCVKMWAGRNYRRNSIESVNSLNTESKLDYEVFKLDHTTSQKLQTLVAQFTLIQQKRIEMPKLCLTTWSSSSTLQNLKISRLLLIMLTHQKSQSRKQHLFNSFRSHYRTLVGFTDIYK